MGRWQVSVSSEMFHRQLRKHRSALGVVGEVGDYQRYCKHEQQERDEKILNNVSATVSATRETEKMMCNGRSDGDDAVVSAAPAEEWSPIREAPPLPHGGYRRFPAEEQNASSDMDTDDDTGPVVRRSSEAVSAVEDRAAAGGLDTDAKGFSAEHGRIFADTCGSDGQDLDESAPVSYVMTTGGEPAPKRRRIAHLGSEPVVEVSYEGLNRESRNVLRQALQSWSHWHSRTFPSGLEVREDVLQSGTEVYSPALDLDPSSINNTISVWMDKPLKKRNTKNPEIQDPLTGDSQDKEKDVPLYDRACASALSHDLGYPNEYVFIEPEEASRCFNCGSYSHALRNCPRPHSVANIRNARDTLANKRGPRSRTPSRYYQRSPSGKFDDLKPGVLSSEARMAIGIGELDPPPWLNRMREIGYPPGYLDTDEESSVLHVIDDDTDGVTGRESNKEEIHEDNLTPVEELKTGPKMTVEYPGINAPVPEDADKELWAVRSATRREEGRGCKRPFHQINQIHNSISGLVSPGTPANSWAVGIGDFDLRDENFRRRILPGQSESYFSSRVVGMESHIDSTASNWYGLTSAAVDMNGYPSADLTNQWSRRRHSGNMYNNAWTGIHAYHQSPSSPSGLASPIRGMLGTPSPMEPMSSPSHIYSRHDYYQSGPPGFPLPSSQSPNPTTSQAWVKAQSALDALRPFHSTRGLLATAHDATGAALHDSRGPGMPDQLGSHRE